jgi:serine/threonine-protein kinase
MPNPVPGTLLGSYQVEGVIGAGSMGDVFRGVDTGLGRKVAIKILAEKHRDSPELRARFVREGRAVAAISHPNVVQVFATGTFDERPFIAMELLDGSDLGSAVEKGGAQPSLAAAQTILDAAKGLSAAARAGLIHRDVKPSNLVRLPDGRVKVTDFGLAKPVDPGTEPALTALGVVVGTPDYIAPEQARGETIDEKVDIYALGGTLYFLLVGTPPFRTGKPAEDKYLKVVARHLRQPAPDAHAVNPAADHELSELARRMMSKRPGERPDYESLIEELEAIVNRLGGSAVPRRAPTSRSQPVSLGGSRSGSRASQAAPPVAATPTGVGTGTPFVGGDAPPAFSDHMDTVVGTTDMVAGLRGPPPWALLLTVMCAIFLIASAIFYFTRSEPTRAATPPPPIDAAVVVTAVPDARPLALPPPGMIAVTRGDGSTFFVDARTVTHAEYAAFYKQHRVPKGAADRPVTGVAYHSARAMAGTNGKRMLRTDEWDAAMKTTGVVASPATMFEWVDGGKDPQDLVKNAAGKIATRTGAPKDVGFRFAKDR